MIRSLAPLSLLLSLLLGIAVSIASGGGSPAHLYAPIHAPLYTLPEAAVTRDSTLGPRPVPRPTARPQIANRTIFTGDNLPVLRRMDDASIDLIYLDPPFNSNRDYAAPIGSEAAGAAFRDTWTLDALDIAWHGEIADREPALYQVISAAGLSHSPAMQAYLSMMAVRLLEMRRVVSPTGSIYLHCDPTAGHYLKALMDSLFGRDNFRRECIWSNEDASGFKSRARNWIRGHDTILYYVASGESTFVKQYQPLSEATIRRYDKTDERGRHKLYRRKDGSIRKVYLDEARGRSMSDTWTDIRGFQTVNNTGESTGYPTQKPLALLERIIRASSNPGDTVLDPFCGCATSCIAAEKLDRKWIGIDLSPLALTLVKRRWEREIGDLLCTVIHRTDIPERTDQGPIPDYRTHRHTLYGQQMGNCAGCNIHFPFANLTVDHILPRSKGGTDHLGNLQLLCAACNSIKGVGSMTDLRARLARRDRDAMAHGIAA